MMEKVILKVLSYWNLNGNKIDTEGIRRVLKVLSYWNLNDEIKKAQMLEAYLKYYHIGI